MTKRFRSAIFIIASFVALLSIGLMGCTKIDEFRVATNAFFPPFEYYDGGSVVGIDIDIANIFADEMGLPLKVSDMEFGSVLASITSGDSDIAMAGLTKTPSREAIVDFATPYFDASQMVIVRDDDTSMDGATDADTVIEVLKGKKIGVILGFTGDMFVSGSEDFEFAGIEGADKKGYSTGVEAIMDLQNNNVDYVIIDNVPANKLVDSANGIKLVDIPLTDEQYAFAVKKGNADLLKKVNDIIDRIKQDGTLDSIVNKHYNK